MLAGEPGGYGQVWTKTMWSVVLGLTRAPYTRGVSDETAAVNSPVRRPFGISASVARFPQFGSSAAPLATLRPDAEPVSDTGRACFLKRFGVSACVTDSLFEAEKAVSRGFISPASWQRARCLPLPLHLRHGPTDTAYFVVVFFFAPDECGCPAAPAEEGVQVSLSTFLGRPPAVASIGTWQLLSQVRVGLRPQPAVAEIRWSP
jgi:hypothetical protein